MRKGATVSEINKAIKLADKEIKAWQEFRDHCKLLICYK